jgi:hypothetical protein
MFRDDISPPAIIQRRLSEEEIRQQVYEECARFLESVSKVRRSELFRGLEIPADKEGWEDMRLTEKHLCKSLAKAIRSGQSRKPQTESK